MCEFSHVIYKENLIKDHSMSSFVIILLILLTYTLD